MDMGLRQKTVALAMMFFAVVVVLSSATFFTIYENMRIETTKKAVESLTAQKKEEVESYFDNLESLAYSIGFSSWMQTLFQPKSLDTRTMQEVSENIEYFLGTISGMNEGVRLAAIMDRGHHLFIWITLYTWKERAGTLYSSTMENTLRKERGKDCIQRARGGI